MQCDLIIRNCRIFNSFLQKFVTADCAVRGGRFFRIAAHLEADGAEIIDGKGRWMIPGLVDIHMHIESSMSIPSRFSDAVLPHGTTTVAADPHEIANVFGEEGILFFLSQDTDLDIFFGIPSSVPSTDPSLETTGGLIGPDEVSRLLKEKRIVCLGEVMNFHDVCFEPDSLSAEIIRTCRAERPCMPLEGHCPKVSGEELSEFLYQGISADHTQQTAASVIEKITNGMFLEIQEKSMSQEVLDTLAENGFYEYFCFVTDDVMADRLRTGHLDRLVRKAIAMGMPAEKAIYCATFTPCRRMHLEDRGAIAPGRIADFILLDDLQTFRIASVYKKGRLVAKKESEVPAVPERFLHSIHCRRAMRGDFEITAAGNEALCNIIEIEPHSTFTHRRLQWLPVKNGRVDWQGYAMLAVYERYGRSGAIARALTSHTIAGSGAIAASWAHDHHNVMVMGTCPEDMELAQHALLEQEGGFVVVQNHQVRASAVLEIGGIVSSAPIEKLGADLENVRRAMQELGYEHDNEIMSFSTLSLLVSPEIKVSDRGMIDTRTQRILPLIEETR